MNKTSNEVIHTCWMIVTSHGIPDTVVQKTVDAAKTYFALPEETKMRVSLLYWKMCCFKSDLLATAGHTQDT